jgi:anti-sigma B factor antagonist
MVEDGATLVAPLGRRNGVRLSGELDIAGLYEVRAALDGRRGDVEVDCAGLSFIDASGLGLFLAVHAERRARGGKLLIVNPSRCVVRLLELTGVGAELQVRGECAAP